MGAVLRFQKKTYLLSGGDLGPGDLPKCKNSTTARGEEILIVKLFDNGET